MNLYKNGSGKNDPTAGAALSNIIREERIKEKHEKKKLQKNRRSESDSREGRKNQKDDG